MIAKQLSIVDSILMPRANYLHLQDSETILADLTPATMREFVIMMNTSGTTCVPAQLLILDEDARIVSAVGHTLSKLCL